MTLQISLKIPVTEEEIKKEVKELTEQIAVREAEARVLREAVRHYQKQCSHPGQVTGNNDRDGSWGNPCPVCGYSY